MNALIISFYSSQEWRSRKPSTQATYRGILERMREELGKYPVKDFQRKHIKAVIDKKAATPAAANRYLSILEILFDYAIDEELRPDNPAKLEKKGEAQKRRLLTVGPMSRCNSSVSIGQSRRLIASCLSFFWGPHSEAAMCAG